MESTLLHIIAQKHKDATSVIDRLNCHFASDDSGFTLLHHSATFGNAEVTQYLLKAGCDVDAQDILRRTPLMLAVIGNHEAVVRILITAGADFNVFNWKSESALYMALTRHEISVSILTSFLTSVKEQFLTNISRIRNMIDADYCISQVVLVKNVISSARCRNAAIVKYMFRRGFSVDSRCPEDNQTPLHVAVILGDQKIVKRLLECGADPNALDIYGQTPLFHLHYHNWENSREKFEILRDLLSSGASLTSCTAKGTFQLTSTLIKGDREVIRTILQSRIDFTAKDKFGDMTALHYLILNRDPEVVEELKLHVNNFDINVVDELGRNPLFGAVIAGNVSMVKFLLECGSDVSLINLADGFPILFYAYTRTTRDLKTQYDECAELLLQYNADPQFVVSTDDKQVTIFDLVSNSNSFKRMKIVVAHLAMLERLGTPITEIIRSKIDEHRLLRKYFERCRRVLEKKITRSISVHELLTNSKSKMARSISGRLVNKFEKLRTKNHVKLVYPYYYYLAEKRYLEAKEYREASVAICKLFKGRIDANNLITQATIKHLDQQSLHTLSQYYKLYV